MKWYNSLITKITLLFALAILGVGAILFTVHNSIKKTEIQNINKYVHVRLGNKEEINLKLFLDDGYEEVKEAKLKKTLVSQKRFFQARKMRNNNPKNRFKVVEFKQDIFVIIAHTLVLKAPHDDEIPKVLIPLSIVVLLLSLYIATIRSILPLYALRQKVKDFANGNYDLDCKSDKKDEIAVLSNEFDASVKKIKKLRDSRQLFLRNIMHELKTPITKGKLSCEMIEDSTYQEILKNVFRRQESLLEEFARIEKLSANELDLDTKQYSLEDIVDFSMDILTHDSDKVTRELANIELHVDFELFGTALKNLIDNGINYSDDKHVKITATKDEMIISNRGKELEFPLEKYAEPYFLDGKKQRSSRGLGFGLFITIHVIKLHKMELTYKREDNKNLFIIKHHFL